MPGDLTSLLTGGNAVKRNQPNGTSEGPCDAVNNETNADTCELHGVIIKPVHDKEDITPLWLSMFLNRKISSDSFSLEPVGTGQMSSTFRVMFHGVDSPESRETVVVKFASSDKVTRDMGLRFGHYLREAIFYRRYADTLSAGLPRCYGSVVDKGGWFSIVLQDLGTSEGYTCGQLEGTDYEHARLALSALAKLQAPLLGNQDLEKDEWLNEAPYLDQKLFNECLPIFLERHPPAQEHRELLYWMSTNLDAWYADNRPPFVVFHGDFRLDNIQFLAKEQHRAVAVDWGGSTAASPLRDVAYFLGNSLRIEDRREWEKDLLKGYLDELNQLSKVKISWNDAWELYAHQSLYGLAQHIPAAGILPDTERGKIMFRTLVSRQAQHALDLNASSLVKPQIISTQPEVADECEHVAPEDADPLWNESWYFDAATADGELGMYARIGRLPHQDCCNFVGGLFRRDEDPVMFIDMHAPLPRSDSVVQEFQAKKFAVESKCIDPLKKFSLKIKGTGTAFSDPSAPLRGGVGENVPDVEMDLTWQTSGAAYKKQGQSRYEIPCLVDGTIKIGDKSFKLEAIPGERNHSWGVRNWWVADWVWSGLHFEDGTHIFTIALGKGPESNGGAGFIQKDGKLTGVSGVVNDFEFSDNGLPGNLRLRIQPGDLRIECETIAAAGLRLLDPEGREAHLPRVMCKARMGGVNGVGWLDFNRVVKREPAKQ